MNIRYLYYPGCHSHEQGLSRLKKVLADQGQNPEIETVCVDSDELARKLGFIGSPTILVDGEDIQGTCSQYRSGVAKWKAMLKYSEKIKKEKPALYEKVKGIMDLNF